MPSASVAVSEAPHPPYVIEEFSGFLALTVAFVAWDT
jgi:hypothetical protein